MDVVKIIIDIKSSEVESSGHSYPSENSFWNFPGNWAIALLAVILCWVELHAMKHPQTGGVDAVVGLAPPAGGVGGVGQSRLLRPHRMTSRTAVVYRQ